MNTIRVLLVLVFVFCSCSGAATSTFSQSEKLCNDSRLWGSEGERAGIVSDHVLLSGALSQWDKDGSLLVGIREDRYPWVMAVRFEEIFKRESPAEYLRRVLDGGEVLRCEKTEEKELVYKCKPPTWSDAMAEIEVSLSVLRVRYKFGAIRGCTVDFIGDMVGCGGNKYQVLCRPGNCGILTFIDWTSGAAQEADCYLNLPFCSDSPGSD